VGLTLDLSSVIDSRGVQGGFGRLGVPFLSKTYSSHLYPWAINNQFRTVSDIIYVGKKPTMNYVLAIVTQFNNNVEQITIKARGKSISKAVDIAEITKHKFIKELKYQSIKLDTEVLEGERGQSNVSSIEILLTR
jgi:DNA-binding protein